MSWPGHFLSRGLVLIKARANRNAPLPLLLVFSLFYGPLSTLTPSTSREAQKSTYFSSSPHVPPLVFVLLSSLQDSCFL